MTSQYCSEKTQWVKAPVTQAWLPEFSLQNLWMNRLLKAAHRLPTCTVWHSPGTQDSGAVFFKTLAPLHSKHFLHSLSVSSFLPLTFPSLSPSLFFLCFSGFWGRSLLTGWLWTGSNLLASSSLVLRLQTYTISLVQYFLATNISELISLTFIQNGPH